MSTDVLAENLKFYRIAAELSQAELARKLGVSRQAVTNWETGKSVPSSEFLYKLCELYGIEFSKLVGQGGIAHVAVATDEKDEETYVPTASDWAKVHVISEFIDKLADDYEMRKMQRKRVVIAVSVLFAMAIVFLLSVTFICAYSRIFPIENGITAYSYQIGFTAKDALLSTCIFTLVVVIVAIAVKSVNKYIQQKERTNEIKE